MNDFGGIELQPQDRARRPQPSGRVAPQPPWVSVAEVARRLGVTENRLHDWKKAVLKRGADAFPGSGHLTPVEEELRRLRADVKRLEMERDNCWDNAPMESFFASPKKELVHHEDYARREEARASIFEYIEAFYNRVRRHSSLGYVAPAEYERTHNPTHR